MHVIVAGLLMHAMHLGGSHYSQYLGISAGIVAVLLSVQPVLTALIAARWMGERLLFLIVTPRPLKNRSNLIGIFFAQPRQNHLANV